MRNYKDFNHRKIPPTKIEQETELKVCGANCPVCGLLGMKIDLLPGEGVLCDIHGIVPLENATEECDRQAEANYVRNCGRPF